MKVIAVYSVKGGVGKSTAAVNVAYEAAKSKRVLLWDLDPQGGATFLLSVKPKVKGGADALVQGNAKIARAVRRSPYENLDVLPADDSARELELALDAAKKSTRRIERALGPLADRYDLVVLDCPPGSALLAQAVIRAADLVVLPLVPSPLSVRSLQQVRDVLAEEKDAPALLGFLSLVDRRKNAHRAAVDELPVSEPDVSDVVVPASVVVERMGAERAPLAVISPRSEPARAFGRLWRTASAVLFPAAKGAKNGSKSGKKKGK